MIDEATRARMQRWRQSIAAGEEQNRLDAIAQAARRTPGENIEAGFALTEFISTFAGSLEREDEVAPSALWRKRHGPR